MIDVDRIAKSGLIGHIDYHDSLGSTNDRALELAATDAVKLPLLVITEQQTAGRGRGLNRWLTTKGALTFSLVPQVPSERFGPERWPHAALAAGLAVCDALQSLAPHAELRLKWPNDVYLAGRKVCGILSESVPGWRDRLIVGIGINVNNSAQEGRDKRQDAGDRVFGAIALIEHDHRLRDLTDVLLAVLDEFDRCWSQLCDGGFAPLAAAYRERCFLTGKLVKIEQPGGGQMSGTCCGIDTQGALRVLTEFGEQTVVSGSVASWEKSQQ